MHGIWFGRGLYVVALGLLVVSVFFLFRTFTRQSEKLLELGERVSAIEASRFTSGDASERIAELWRAVADQKQAPPGWFEDRMRRLEALLEQLRRDD